MTEEMSSDDRRERSRRPFAASALPFGSLTSADQNGLLDRMEWSTSPFGLLTATDHIALTNRSDRSDRAKGALTITDGSTRPLESADRSSPRTPQEKVSLSDPNGRCVYWVIRRNR